MEPPLKLQKVSKILTGPKWWWASFALASVGLISSRYIYVSNLSFWLRRPDAVATGAAIALAVVCLGVFLLMSARRAAEIGSSPKALLTNLLIIPIPFWIFALGFIPTKTDSNPRPLAPFLSNLKIAGSIMVVVGAGAIAADYYLNDRKVSGNAGSAAKRGGQHKELDITQTLSDCYRNGIAYFKEIGSYPRLHTTGEYAPDVVKELCQRSGLAFGR